MNKGFYKMKKRKMYSKAQLSEASKIARAMYDIGKNHENDLISNQYMRTASKIETIGTAFSAKFKKIDVLTIKTFLKTYRLVN